MSTFKKAKNSYTQEELDRLLDEQASITTAEMLEKFKDYKSREEVEALIREWASYTVTGRGQWWKPEDLNKWIKENL